MVDWMMLTPLRQCSENPAKQMRTFSFCPVKLDDGARKQYDEVALPDFGIYKIDGYVMEPSVHKAKIHAFSLARLLVDVQDVFRDICPCNQVYGKVDVWKFHKRCRFWSVQSYTFIFQSPPF